MQNRSENSTGFTLLVITIIAAFTLDQSSIDMFISKLLYHNGQWLIEKGAQPYAFIFYTLPKILLISFAIYLLIVLLIYWKKSTVSHTTFNSLNLNEYILPFSVRESVYLLSAFILVPATMATFKTVTHVSCPSDLAIFGGQAPYLDIWHSIRAHSSNKCFPAAHASTGFALYAFVFLPRFYQNRHHLFEIVSVIGWCLGVYKMLIGDHFFSHTLISMLLSLTLTYYLSKLFFATHKIKFINPLNKQFK